MKRTINYIFLTMLVVLFCQCTSEDSNTQYVAPNDPVISHVNDQYLYNNGGKSFFERYNTATRWRWNDNFINPSQRATPIRAEFVIPATKLVDYLWIGPYAATGVDAAKFINDLFPAELIYIGSYIFNDDGSQLLGYAEGGARVTLLNMNGLDFQDSFWLASPGPGILTTVHHEFSHIVEQKYGLPIGFNTISESYLGANWANGVSRDDAIKLGMVRDYATSSEHEDFCEIISHLLVVDKATFEEDFITQEDCSSYTDSDAIVNCRELNDGRKLIKQKVDLVTSFYESTVHVNLLAVRDTLQTRLEKLIATGVIPD